MKTLLARFAMAVPLQVALTAAIHHFDIDKGFALAFFVGLASWSSVVAFTSAWEKE